MRFHRILLYYSVSLCSAVFCCILCYSVAFAMNLLSFQVIWDVGMQRLCRFLQAYVTIWGSYCAHFMVLDCFIVFYNIFLNFMLFACICSEFAITSCHLGSCNAAFVSISASICNDMGQLLCAFHCIFWYLVVFDSLWSWYFIVFYCILCYVMWFYDTVWYFMSFGPKRDSSKTDRPSEPACER